MRKLLLGLVFAMFTTVAHADYTMVVPKSGGGTSVWAEIVAKELEKYPEKTLRSNISPEQEIFQDLTNGIMKCGMMTK